MISVLPTSGNLIHPWEDSTCVIPPCQVPSGPSSQTWTFSGRTYPLSRLCLLILHTTFLSHLPGNFPLSRNGSLLVTSWLWNEETAGERRGWNEAETKFSVCRFHLHSRTVCVRRQKWKTNGGDKRQKKIVAEKKEKKGNCKRAKVWSAEEESLQPHQSLAVSAWSKRDMSNLAVVKLVWSIN